MKTSTFLQAPKHAFMSIPPLTFPYKRSPAQQKAAAHFSANVTDGLFNAQRCTLKRLFSTCGPGEASIQVPASPSLQCVCCHTKITKKSLPRFGKNHRKDPLCDSTALAGISFTASWGQFSFFFSNMYINSTIFY